MDIRQGVNSKSCKQDEIEFLETVAEKCEAGSYLASLFSPEMIRWAMQKIQDDVMPDIFGKHEEERDMRLAALEQKLANQFEYQARIDEARQKLEGAEREIQSLRNTNDRLAADYEDLEADLRNVESGRRAMLDAKLAAKQAKRAAEWKQEVEARELQQQITELKAALYDAAQREKDLEQCVEQWMTKARELQGDEEKEE